MIAVDERMGIVWLRMAWGVREEGGDQLTVWETFKVYDGQIHAVEAFMRILPIDKRNGGLGVAPEVGRGPHPHLESAGVPAVAPGFNGAVSETRYLRGLS